jgi:hypothetical protein
MGVFLQSSMLPPVTDAVTITVGSALLPVAVWHGGVQETFIVDVVD